MKKKKWQLAAASVIAIALISGTKAEARDDAYRVPQLSGVTKTWVYQGETFDRNWDRMLADDQEDGDLTKMLSSSGNVDTSKTGTYTLTRKVQDSDGNVASLDTQVTVLDKNTATEEEKTVQRTLYTLPNADHLTGISFNRGYYHDRQNLGIWMPQGSSIQIRIVNAETFKEDLTIQFENDDSQTESSAKIPADGSWVTLSNTKMVDSVPFITTPKRTTVQPVVEYKYTDALKEIPYYRYGDSQQAFFDAWDESQAPFAIIEGSAATFLVPVCDKDNIINSSYGNKKDVYRFKTLDEMLEWYAAFVKQYDAYAGLDFDAKEPWNQNVRAKFFIKANAHGAGQAYYSKDHSAYNGKSLDTYLVRDWLSLHEFGHGYEGAIAAQENPFVETTNNILGYYFEPTYRPEEDFGWLLENFTGTKAQRYAQLGQRMKDRLDTTNTFADIVEGGNYYNVSLYMFTNLMNKLGPQKAVSAMHSYYRQVYYLTGKKMASSDALAESLDTLGYNVLPYFKAWHIVPSGKVEDKIYAMDKPMLYFLKELIPDDTACETTRVQLGLEGIYSLVSTDDLSATGYISKVSLDVQIDDLEQVKGKKIQIKNGDKVVKELTISDSRVTCELPVGIYKVEMPSPNSNVYQYGNEYLVASVGNVSKTLVYTKQSGNPLADDAQIQLLGLGDALVATVKVDTVSQKLIWTLSSTTPHMYIDGTYIRIQVLSPDGKELYSQELQGKQKTEKSNLKVDFPVGSKLILYHRESKGRQRFMSSYTGEILSDYQIAESGQTTTYLMTEKGLMQSDWKNEKQMNVYAQTLSQYSQYLFENMTREEIAESSQYHNQKTTILLAYEKLDEDAKKAYQRQYGILIGMEPEEAYAYAMIENSHLTAMADSEHPGEGASLALDGDTSTIWHSNYGNGIKADIAGNKNNTYTILLDGNMDIGKLAYLPRQGGNNGTILKYELSYSTTASGDDFQTISIKDNTWANDQKQKEVTFDAPSARRIRIRALSTAGNPADTYISAAQFYLYEKYSIYAKKTYLSDLYQTPDEKGNTVNTDKNADGTEISLLVNGTERNFEKGIGLKTGESALWDLSGLGSNSLSFLAGIKAGENASAIVEVYGDGQLLYTTQTLKAGENAEDVYLDISNIKVLKICAVSENRNVQVALADVKLGNAADKEALSLKIGDQAVFLRNNALAPEDRGKAVFKSSNDAVVSVNEKGVVTAVAAGTAEVTADFGKEKVTCQITVTEKTKPEEKPDESVRAELAEAVASEEYKAVYDSGNTDGSYTESSWKAYKKAYENALNPDEKASEEELKELLRKLQEARAGLKTVKKEAEEKLAEAVASEEYKTVYDRGNTDGSYTESSWEAYKKAYENALNPDEKASEEDLKELLSKLQEARAGLKTAGGEVPSEAPTEKPTETQPASGTPSTPAPEVTKTDQTVRGNVIYRILDEKKKTAAVIGAGGNKGKNVTSVTIAKTVNINGVTYKVVQIGKNAFKGCKKLKKVTIGSNIKKIGGSAFVNCSKLKTINMKKANGITSIGSKAFRKINANAKVTVPAKKFKKYSKMLKRAGLPKKAGIKK